MELDYESWQRREEALELEDEQRLKRELLGRVWDVETGCTAAEIEELPMFRQISVRPVKPTAPEFQDKEVA